MIADYGRIGLEVLSQPRKAVPVAAHQAPEDILEFSFDPRRIKPDSKAFRSLVRKLDVARGKRAYVELPALTLLQEGLFSHTFPRRGPIHFRVSLAPGRLARISIGVTSFQVNP